MPERPRIVDALILAALAVPVFFFGLDRYSVVNGDEAYYHSAAVAMVESGNWFRLDYHGDHRVYDTFMNAPLHYWARAVLVAVFGDSLWTMRALSAAFGVLTVVATWRLALEVGGKRWPAVAAGLVQLTNYHFVFLHGGRTGELDAIVCFLVTSIALAFLRAVRGEGSFVVHHLLLGALLTVKLPLGAVPVVAELALFATTPSIRQHFRRYALSGFAIVPIALLWHAGQAVAIWDEFVEVMTKMSGEASGSVGQGDRLGSPATNGPWYLERMLFGAFPWSIAMVPAAAFALFASLRRVEGGPEPVAARVVVAFGLAVFAFFVLVSKRYPWYVLPCYPFLAVALAGGLGALAVRGRVLAGTVVLAAVLAFWAWIVVPFDVRPVVVRAPLLQMESAWREVGAIGTFAGLGITAALLVVGFLLASNALKERAGAVLGSACFVALLAYAGARVVLPLGDLEYTSDLEERFQKVERARENDRLTFPIDIPEPEGYLRTRYYFGRDYRMTRTVRRSSIDRRVYPVIAIEGLKQDR